MTTFHDLIHAVTWEDVRPLLEDYDEFPEGYERVFDRLREMQPEPEEEEEDRFTLLIRFQPQFALGPGARASRLYSHVYGVLPDDPTTHWAVEFRPWKHWLAAPIHPKSLANYTNAQIVAACLWELTWGGFDEIQQARRISELDQAEAEACDPNVPKISLEELEEEMRRREQDSSSPA